MRKYKFALPEGTNREKIFEGVLALTLAPKNPIPLIVTKR